MAIYHLNARGIAPARGSSAVASAAYQSGETLRDEATGELKRYARAERIADTGIILPGGMPVIAAATATNGSRPFWERFAALETGHGGMGVLAPPSLP